MIVCVVSLYVADIYVVCILYILYVLHTCGHNMGTLFVKAFPLYFQ